MRRFAVPRVPGSLALLVLLSVALPASAQQEWGLVLVHVFGPDGRTRVRAETVRLEDPGTPLQDTIGEARTASVPAEGAGAPLVLAPMGGTDWRYLGGAPVGTWRLCVYAVGQRLCAPVDVTVAVGGVADIPVVLPADAVVEGRLLHADGTTPAAGWTVTLARGDAPAPSRRIPIHYGETARTLTGLVCETREDGVFFVGTRTRGDWRATALAGMSGDAFDLGVVRTAAAPGTVELKLPELPKVSGRIVGVDGSPLAGANVRVCVVEPGARAAGEIPVTTGAGGEFRTYWPVRGPCDIHVVSEAGWDVERRVPPDAMGDLRLGLRTGATLRLTAYDRSLRPMPGATVAAGVHVQVTSFAPSYQAVTDADGSAVMRNVAPGLYSLTVGWQGSRRTVLLGPGDDLAADVVLTDVIEPTAGGGTVDVSGRAVQADGTPLVGARAYLDRLAPSAFYPAGREPSPVATDENGKFSFPGVSSGYHILTLMSDVGPVALTPFFAPRSEPQLTVDVDVPAERCAVVGHADFAADGRPAAGARVFLLEVRQFASTRRDPATDPSYLPLSLEVQPDGGEALLWEGGFSKDPASLCYRSGVAEDGSFRFDGVIPGLYVAMALTAEHRAATSVEVEPDGPVEASPLHLASTSDMAVTGRLLDADGQPITGRDLRVSCVSPSGVMFAPRPLSVADDGTFSVAVGAPGWYSLGFSGDALAPVDYHGAVVRADGRPEPISVVPSRPSGPSAPVAVHVLSPDGSPTGQPMWVLPVRVTEQPFSSVEVFPELASLADGAGACAIEGLPAGMYCFVSRSPAKGRLDGTTWFACSDIVEVGPEPLAVTLAADLTGWIEGTVVRQDGTPVAGAQVDVPVGMGRPQVHNVLCWGSAVSGPDGRFTVTGLEAGSRSVMASGGPIGSGAGIALPQATVDVRPGEFAPCALILADSQAPEQVAQNTVSGIVVAEDGSPVPGALVWAESQGGWGIPPQALTDDSGRFELKDVPPWGGAVLAWAAGAGRGLVPLQSGGLPVATPNAPQGGAQELVVQLARTSGITGRVALPAADDPAIGDLTVSAKRTDVWTPSGGVSAPVGADGRFTLTGLGPGEYSVEVSWRGLPRCPGQTVTVEAGQVAEASFDVPPLGSVVGCTVTEVDAVTPLANAQLTLSWFNGQGLSCTTDRQGYFAVHNAPMGTHSLQILQAGMFATVLGDLTIDLPEGDLLFPRKQGQLVRGRVVPAAGMTLPPTLLVGLDISKFVGGAVGPVLLQPTRLNADGSYLLTAFQAGKTDVWLLAGRTRPVTKQQVDVKPNAVTVAPDLVWQGL